MTTPPPHFAYFITPHGYGHAARAAAVMLAMRRMNPLAAFEIFTKVPPWFFFDSLQSGFGYHDLLTDIGLAQDSVMEENLPETVRRLDALLPFRPAKVRALAEQVRASGCRAVLCDVAPLGIAVAHAAGLPAVLIENFTWDWIYEGYLAAEPALAEPIALLRAAFAQADAHIRTLPACDFSSPADLTTQPVGRRARTAPALTRAALGIDPARPVVLLTMGGIGGAYPFLDALAANPAATFIVPGGSERFEKRGNLILLAHHSNYYHPDLLAASDLVIGKLGYSTLAETYLAGLRFAFIPRPRFRESDAMRGYAIEKLNGIEVNESRFSSGSWMAELPDWLAGARPTPPTQDGADQVAQFVLENYA